MIKILQCRPQADLMLELEFSGGEVGHFDGLAYLASRSGALLEPLREKLYFQRAFVDAGALCWPNGLELSGARMRELCHQLEPH